MGSLLRFFNLLFGKLFNKLAAHTPCSGLTASTHRAWLFDQLTSESYYSVLDIAVPDLSCQINTIADKGILKTKVKGVFELLIAYVDKIEKPLRTLRSLEWLLTLLLILLGNLIKANELSITNPMLSKIAYASLSIVNRIDNYVIKNSARCCNGAIVDCINSAKIT